MKVEKIDHVHIHVKNLDEAGLEVGDLKQAWFHPKDAHGLSMELCECSASNALEAVRQGSG